MRIVSLLAALGLILAACAAEPPVTGPAPGYLIYAEPGTGLVLASTIDGTPRETRITAAAAAPPRGAFRREDGSIGGFYPGCWDCGGEMRIEEDRYAALWPLETGNEVAFLRVAPDGTRARILIRVGGTETIETQAGRFETYRLEGRAQHLAGPEYSAEVTAWWAPDPGWVVRAEGSDSRGRVLTSEVVEIIQP